MNVEVNRQMVIETATYRIQEAISIILNIHQRMDVTINFSFATGKGSPDKIIISNNISYPYSYSYIQEKIVSYYYKLNEANGAIDNASNVNDDDIIINGKPYKRESFNSLNIDSILFLNRLYRYFDKKEDELSLYNSFINVLDINSSEYSFHGDSQFSSNLPMSSIPIVSSNKYDQFLSGMENVIGIYFDTSTGHYDKVFKVEGICDFGPYFYRLFELYESNKINLDHFEKTTFFDSSIYSDQKLSNNFSYYGNLSTTNTRDVLKYGYFILYYNFIHASKSFSYISEQYITCIKKVNDIFSSATPISTLKSFAEVKKKFLTDISDIVSKLTAELKNEFNVNGARHVMYLFDRVVVSLDFETIFSNVENDSNFDKINDNSKLCKLKNEIQSMSITSLDSLLKTYTKNSEYYHIDNLLLYINIIIMNGLKSLVEYDTELCSSYSSDMIASSDSSGNESFVGRYYREGFTPLGIKLKQENQQGNLNLYENDISQMKFLDKFDFSVGAANSATGNNYEDLNKFVMKTFNMVERDFNDEEYECYTGNNNTKFLDASMTYKCLDQTYEAGSRELAGSVFPIQRNCIMNHCKRYRLKLKYQSEFDEENLEQIKAIYFKVLVEDEEDGEDENLNNSHIYVIPREGAGDILKNALLPYSANTPIFELNTENKNIMYSNDELFTEDLLFKVCFENSNLVVKYQLGQCKLINDSDDGNVMGDIENSQNYLALYQLDKYYYPEHISKAGYVDNNGHLNVYNNHTTQNMVRKRDLSYERYDEFVIYDISKLNHQNSGPYYSMNVAKNTADGHSDIIAIYYNNSAYYLITYSDLENLYHDQSKKDHYIMLKMIGIPEGSYDHSCPSLSNHVNMITTDYWEAYESNDLAKNYDKNEIKCGFKNYFGDDLKQQETAYLELQNAFDGFMDSYIAIMDEDKALINDTNVSVEELKETIKEYNKIQKESQASKTKFETSNAQMVESANDLRKSEFWFALSGIAALSAMTIMITSLKK